MNCIKEIAQILGVEIGEEFKIEGYEEAKYKFDDNLMRLFPNGEWYTAPQTLYKILDGRYKIIKIPKSLLTEEEREYLSYVIKPFRDEIEYIHKFTCPNSKKEYLMGFIKDIGYHLELPPFIKGTMYCGIELGKEYTLEELGL